MYGKIFFTSLEDLAEFLKAFTGANAVFEVTKQAHQWVLEFTGGN